MFRVNSTKEIERFVDKYITTDKTLLPEALQEAQTHKHLHTCRKKCQSLCRFHYPLPLMKKTLVLQPLEDMNECNFSFLKEKDKKIFIFLKDLGTGIEMKFEEFLNKFEINEETYILAIRSQLNRPQIFLKQGLNDKRTNAFN